MLRAVDMESASQARPIHRSSCRRARAAEAEVVVAAAAAIVEVATLEFLRPALVALHVAIPIAADDTE